MHSLARALSNRAAAKKAAETAVEKAAEKPPEKAAENEYYETPRGRHRYSVGNYWRAGPAKELSPVDAKILAAEDAYRADPGRAPPPAVLDVFEDAALSEVATYSVIEYPGGGAATSPPPLVQSLAEFKLNMKCFTMALDGLFFDGLPFVLAGGAVLGALHEWPEAWGRGEIAMVCKEVDRHRKNKKPSLEDRTDIDWIDEEPRAKTPKPCTCPLTEARELIAAGHADGCPSKPGQDSSDSEIKGGAGGDSSASSSDEEYSARQPLKKRTTLYIQAIHHLARTAPAAPNRTIAKANFMRGVRLAKRKYRSSLEIEYLFNGSDAQNKDKIDNAHWILKYDHLVFRDGAPRRFLEQHLPRDLAGICLAYHTPTTVELMGFKGPRALALRSFRKSDVDMFIVAKTAKEATSAIVTLCGRVQRLVGEKFDISRTLGAITLHLPWPYPKLQVVLRLYESVGQVLMGFDLDCCAVAYDGKRVVASPRGLRALQTRQNIVNPTRQSTTYEARLLKYARRGFAVAVPGATAEYLASREKDAKAFLAKAPEKGLLRGITALMVMLELIRRRGYMPTGGHGVLEKHAEVKKLNTELGFNPNAADYDCKKIRECLRETPSELPRARHIRSEDIRFVLDATRENSEGTRLALAAGIPARVEFVSSEPWVQGRCEAVSQKTHRAAATLADRIGALERVINAVKGEVAAINAGARDEKAAAEKRRELAEVVEAAKNAALAPTAAEDLEAQMEALAESLRTGPETVEAERLEAVMIGGGAAGRKLYTGSFNAEVYNWYAPIKWS